MRQQGGEIYVCPSTCEKMILGSEGEGLPGAQHMHDGPRRALRHWSLWHLPVPSTSLRAIPEIAMYAAVLRTII